MGTGTVCGLNSWVRCGIGSGFFGDRVGSWIASGVGCGVIGWIKCGQRRGIVGRTRSWLCLSTASENEK